MRVVLLLSKVCVVPGRPSATVLAQSHLYHVAPRCSTSHAAELTSRTCGRLQRAV